MKATNVGRPESHRGDNEPMTDDGTPGSRSVWVLSLSAHYYPIDAPDTANGAANAAERAR